MIKKVLLAVAVICLFAAPAVFAEHLTLVYIDGYETNLPIVEYNTSVDSMGRCGLMFNYYTPDYGNLSIASASRIIFDDGMIVEVTYPSEGLVEIRKVINTDGTILWFLWNTTWGGLDHQYIVIENTPSNEWKAYTFIPDTSHPEDIGKNLTYLGVVADPVSLDLPELGTWPQDGITVTYPAIATQYYSSGQIKYKQDGSSIYGYLDENFYGGTSRQGRVAWSYNTDNGNYQAYYYYNNTTDRVKTWNYCYHGDWVNDEFQATGEFRYIFETYYNEKFYPFFPQNGAISPRDGRGRVYQSRSESGIETYFAYYSGTDIPAAGIQEMRFGANMYVKGSVKWYYDTGFTNKKVQLILEHDSTGPDGSKIGGTVVDFSVAEDGAWIMQKIAYPDGATYWFLYDAVYEGTANVVLEKTASGAWNAYTFDPNLEPQELVDKTKWTWLENNVGDQTTIVNNYWPAINPADWPLSGPALDYPQQPNAFTYYDSGNIKTYYDGWNRQLYMFEDRDYYNYLIGNPASHGQGRLIGYEQRNPDGTLDQFYEFEYLGDTLEVNKITNCVWEDDVIIQGAEEESIFYKENLYANPRVAVDSGGNKIICTLVLTEEETHFCNAYIVKYNSSGVYQWSQKIPTNTLSFDNAIAVDDEGNIFVAVTKWDGLNPGSNDVYVYKYSPSGAQIGSPYQLSNPSSHDFVYYAMTDSSGDVIVMGTRGDWSNNSNLFIAKLKSDLTVKLWEKTYDSGFSDQTYYMTLDMAGNIVIHANCSDDTGTHPRYYTVTYDTNGQQLAVNYDEIEFGGPGLWLGAWPTGRDYKSTETMINGVPSVWYDYAYKQGTDITLVERDEGGVLPFPAPDNNLVVYMFYNQNTKKQLGAYAIFDNGMTGEAIIDEYDEEIVYITKLNGYNNNTYWFLWDANYVYDSTSYDYVAIEKTASDEWKAYTFNPAATDFGTFMSSFVELGPIASPDPSSLPELGDWWQYCRENNIIPEFPALTSDSPTKDVWGRVTSRVDHNPYLDVTNTYTWGYNALYLVKWDISYDYGKNGSVDPIYSRVYFNNFDFDLNNIGNWYLVSETNNLTGVTTSHVTYEYDAGKIIKTIFDNGDFITTSYWPSSGNKKEDGFWGPGWVWQKTIQYDATGTIMQFQWVVDAHPGMPGDAVEYDYDDKGRMVRKFLDTGEITLIYYLTNNADSSVIATMLLDSAWNWKKTIAYWPNTIIMQYQWLVDPNSTTPGDGIEYHYDDKGRMIRKFLDTGEIVLTYYWTNTIDSPVSAIMFLDSSWNWKKTIQYDATGTIMQYQWLVDPNPTKTGDAVEYHYDALGREIRKFLDTGEIILSYYWNDNVDSPKSAIMFLDSSWNWKKTIQYDATGTKMEAQWITDPNPSAPGDAIEFHYDSQGCIIRQFLDSGDIILTYYWDSTANAPKKTDIFLDFSWNWKKTIEYYNDGTTMHYQWLADQNPSTTGDLVFEEYNSSGECIFRRYDDGSTWTATTSLAIKEQPVAVISQEAIARIELQAKTSQQNPDGVTLTSQMAVQPKTQELVAN